MQKATKKDMSDPREFVKFWFKISGKTSKDAQRDPSLFGTMCLDYNSFFGKLKIAQNDKKLKPIPEKLLQYAYSEYLDHVRQQELAAAIEPVRCEEENLLPLKTYIKAVTGDERPSDLAVLAHWIWLVKRKINALPVLHQVMPIFYGKQGGGKTIALKKLIAPINDYRLNLQMNQLGDGRQYEAFSQNFVVLFDELQGIERTDLNALKNQITTEFNSYRKLHTHITVSVPQRCSFIGATNKPVNENFSDSTGMRRFWEVKTLDKLNWELLNSIDFMELWQGIDESKEHGYLTNDALELIHTEQQSMVNSDDIDEFIDANELKIVDPANVSEISHEALYEHYVLWANRMNISSKANGIWFGRKMNRRIPNRVGKNAKGKNIRLYTVNASATILNQALTVLSLKGV